MKTIKDGDRNIRLIVDKDTMLQFDNELKGQLKITIPGNLITYYHNKKSILFENYYEAETATMVNLNLNPDEYEVIGTTSGLRERGKGNHFPGSSGIMVIDGYEIVIQKII